MPASCSISMRRSSRASPRITAKPPVTAINGIDIQALRRSELVVETKLSSEQGPPLLALLGLDRASRSAMAPRDSRAPQRCMGRAAAGQGEAFRKGLDAEAQGSAEPLAQEAKANLILKIRQRQFRAAARSQASRHAGADIGLSSRLSRCRQQMALDDLDSSIAGSRLRGRLALALDDEKSIEGEIGLDPLALAPAFALAIGAAGHDAAEPLGAGLVKGWRGRVAFQALRGVLPGGSELQPVSGPQGDGQSLVFDDIKGKIGGGEASATIDARPGANGIALNASVQLSDVDGTALRYRNLAMPAGRASLQMTLTSQGRSAAALTGALSGSGTVTLDGAKFAGLDPRAFEAAVRASDSGQANDDARLKQIVEPALLAGALSVGSAQIPFTIRDGRMRVAATTLDANGVRAMISGGYDIPADQADIRAALALTLVGPGPAGPKFNCSRPARPMR